MQPRLGRGSCKTAIQSRMRLSRRRTFLTRRRCSLRQAARAASETLLSWASGERTTNADSATGSDEGCGNRESGLADGQGTGSANRAECSARCPGLDADAVGAVLLGYRDSSALSRCSSWLNHVTNAVMPAALAALHPIEAAGAVETGGCTGERSRAAARRITSSVVSETTLAREDQAATCWTHGSMP